MSNIEKFEQCCAELLVLFYESFPVKVNISISDYLNYDNPENSELFFSTIEFLTDEKFIRYDSDVYGGYMGVVLTSKGLAVLNKSFDDELLGVKIKSAVNEHNLVSISALIKVLVSNSF